MTSVAAADSPEVGGKFPDLAGFSLEGALPEQGAARVQIVDFWASWCAPCKASFPVYEELHAEFGSRGLQIIAVSVDRNRKAMDQFLQRQKVGFAVVRDAEMKLVELIAPPAMPTAYVLDAAGVVRYIHVGFRGEDSKREYVRQIETLLKDNG